MKTKPYIGTVVLVEDGTRLTDQAITQTRYFYFAENGIRFDFHSGESLNHEETGLVRCKLDLGSLQRLNSPTDFGKFVFTHWTTVRPVGAGGIARVRLRKTKINWIDDKGRRYNLSKNNGFSTCGNYRLHGTIQPLDKNGAIPKVTK